MRIISLMLALATPALAEQKSTVDVLTRGQQNFDSRGRVTSTGDSPSCWASACSYLRL